MNKPIQRFMDMGRDDMHIVGVTHFGGSSKKKAEG